MKIGTLTFHRTTNYGAILQTYALQQAIISLGGETEVIDYYSDVIERRYEAKEFSYYLHPRILYNILFQNSFIRDNRISFKNFADKYIKLSPEKYTKNNIAKANNEYDCFVVGSDQVWNGECMGWDENYLLSFVDSSKRNAYAASFGFDTIDKSHSDWYRHKLSDFQHVGVREFSGMKLFESVTGNRSEYVLDPTLLLDKQHWDILVSNKRCKSRYILLYLLQETRSIFNKAQELSRITGLEIIYINDRLFHRKSVHNEFYVSPGEWLGLFMNADYILTNSFHGTIFAINFNIPFWTELLPPPTKVNSRMKDILELTRLSERILQNNTDFCEDVQFEKVNQIIAEQRNKSLNFLKSIYNFK